MKMCMGIAAVFILIFGFSTVNGFENPPTLPEETIEGLKQIIMEKEDENRVLERRMTIMEEERREYEQQITQMKEDMEQQAKIIEMQGKSISLFRPLLNSNPNMTDISCGCLPMATPPTTLKPSRIDYQCEGQWNRSYSLECDRGVCGTNQFPSCDEPVLWENVDVSYEDCQQVSLNGTSHLCGQGWRQEKKTSGAIGSGLLTELVKTSCNDCGDISTALDWQPWGPCSDGEGNMDRPGRICRRRGNTKIGFQEEEAAGQDVSQHPCISTPFAYKEIFEEIQWNIGVPPKCVSQNLFTTIQGPYDCPINKNPLPPTVSTYETSTWGWVSPSINLEVFLDIASRHTGDPYGTVAEMCKFVGITDDKINSNCSYTLAVFEKQKAKEHGLFAPTWAAWLNDYFSLTFNWEVQKELVLGGFEDFDHMTGCHNRTVAPNALCSPDFNESWNLCKVAIYGGTEACANKFGETYEGGLGASAAHTRAFLLVCMDANPFFTGVGYGWNGKDFTGPEFLVDNVNLEEDLGAARFTVYSP